MLPDPNFDIHSRRQPTATNDIYITPQQILTTIKGERLYVSRLSYTGLLRLDPSIAWKRYPSVPQNHYRVAPVPPYCSTRDCPFVHKARYHSSPPFSVHIHARVGSATVIIRLTPKVYTSSISSEVL